MKAFEKELNEKGLSPKTVKNHIENVDFYINEFLLREDALPMENGLNHLDSFFWYFIHRCMWSTPSAVKGMAASLKKFYKCMAGHGKIDAVDYELFASDIKESIPEWVEECEEY